MIDIDKASDFMQTHARVIDRRRFELLTAGGDPDGAVAALAGYANPDGGFGWALEPDLRAAGSQPAGALHAFEVLEEIAPATSPLAVRLCDWLESVSLADGGLPFAVPGAAGPGSAPWWAGADHSTSRRSRGARCGRCWTRRSSPPIRGAWPASSRMTAAGTSTGRPRRRPRCWSGAATPPSAP